MTESEWLSCRESQVMLGFLREKADEARLRRFSVACCRRAVEAVEKDLDEGISADERVAAARGAADALADAYAALDIRIKRNGHLSHAAAAAAFCSYSPQVPLPRKAGLRVISGPFDRAVMTACESAGANAVSGVRHIASIPESHARLFELDQVECAEQAELIRTIFGNPFSPPRPI